MADKAVERGRLERRRLELAPAPMIIDLVQAEQFEMVDQERRDKEYAPAKAGKAYQ